MAWGSLLAAVNEVTKVHVDFRGASKGEMSAPVYLLLSLIIFIFTFLHRIYSMLKDIYYLSGVHASKDAGKVVEGSKRPSLVVALKQKCWGGAKCCRQ